MSPLAVYSKDSKLFIVDIYQRRQNYALCCVQVIQQYKNRVRRNMATSNISHHRLHQSNMWVVESLVLHVGSLGLCVWVDVGNSFTHNTHIVYNCVYG